MVYKPPNPTFHEKQATLYALHKMLVIATDFVTWSVCVSVGHVHKLYKNG